MSHNRLDYVRRMRERGHRFTIQRQVILDAVCEGQGHTTFDEIYARVRARAPTLNRATLYRTLDFLRELRLIVAADLGGRTVYEIAGETPHHHLVCRACGKQVPLAHDAVQALFARIEREHRFAVDTDHLALFGLCEKCRRSPRRARG